MDRAAREEAQEEKRRQKEQRRMEYRRSRLSPQWKLTLERKFNCSEAKKLTAMEIMDLVDNGTLTNEQAEVHFKKLEEVDIDPNNTSDQGPSDKTLDTATTKKAKEVLNRLIKSKIVEMI